jgi:N6-L-threonylcarbamoyladenine synthase
VLQYVRKHPTSGAADLAASFQQAVIEVLVRKTLAAVRQCGVSQVVVTGGVAANSQLRRDMQRACAEGGFQLVIPHPRFCTDNGAMIAAAGYLRYRRGEAIQSTLELLELDASADDRLVSSPLV